MLQIVTGGQGGGKSFYLVHEMVEWLRDDADRPASPITFPCPRCEGSREDPSTGLECRRCDGEGILTTGAGRCICTNLPIKPWELCLFAAMGDQNLARKFLQRIYIFGGENYDAGTLDCLSGLKSTIRARVEVSEEGSDRLEFEEREIEVGHIFSEADILNFWEFTPSGSWIVLDEAYQHFDCRKTMDRNKREDFMAYIRQHRHYKDDIFLVSHNYKDIDITIRRGCTDRVYVWNSLKREVFEGEKGALASCFKGLTWPIQFFTVQHMVQNDGKWVDQHKQRLWPYGENKKIFDCYASFSSATGLGKKAAGADSTSQDYGSSYWKVVSRTASALMPLICIVGAIAVMIGIIAFSWDDLTGKLFKSGTPINQIKRDLESDTETVKAVGPAVVPFGTEVSAATDNVKTDSDVTVRAFVPSIGPPLPGTKEDSGKVVTSVRSVPVRRSVPEVPSSAVKVEDPLSFFDSVSVYGSKGVVFKSGLCLGVGEVYKGFTVAEIKEGSIKCTKDSDVFYYYFQ